MSPSQQRIVSRFRRQCGVLVTDVTAPNKQQVIEVKLITTCGSKHHYKIDKTGHIS